MFNIIIEYGNKLSFWRQTMVKVDENEFYRQATMRICGSLDIEVGLSSLIKYLKPFIPVNYIYFDNYEEDLGAVRTIARAAECRGEKLDVLTSLSPESNKLILDLCRKMKTSYAEIDNQAQNTPLVMEFTENICSSDVCGVEAFSLLSLHLVMDGKFLGGVVIMAEGENRYIEEHKDLLMLLDVPFCVAASNTLRFREIMRLKDLLTDDNRYLHRELLRISGDDIIGENFGLREVMDQARQVTPLNNSVLLLGETGVGKDVIANAIHYSSPRQQAPFITVNCGAIPDTLIDSELFGHEKGAFSGAINQKRGRFERANGGTIFLDEIGELPPPAQIRLLRVLENKEIERVGGSDPISLDVRIMAATHRNLPRMVQEGSFREDLLFRLNVFPITIPPLRERRMDIPALVQHFIDRKSKDLKLHTPPKLATGAIDRLMDYDWPGNVRELGNVVERSLILNSNGSLSFDNLLPGSRQDISPLPATAGDSLPIGSRKLDDVISAHLRQVLKETEGRINGSDGAAQILGINPSTLRNKLIKLDIPYGRTGN